MKTKLERLAGIAVFTASILFVSQNASGLGHDFFTNKVVSMPGFVEYPKGFEELVNSTNRIAGYDVNAEMVFFFSGKPRDFTLFLEAYSRLAVAADHRLVLHEGTGEAKSPWSKTGQPCDWKLYAAPEGWLEARRLLTQGTNSLAAVRTAAKDLTNYVIRVHFWTGGRIPWNRARVPNNVKIEKIHG